jgi:hypothetical protein
MPRRGSGWSFDVRVDDCENILEYANPVEDVQPPDVAVVNDADGTLTLIAPCPGRVVASLAAAACFGGAVVMSLLIAHAFDRYRDGDRVVAAAMLGVFGMLFGVLFIRMVLRPVVFVVTPTSIEVRGGALIRNRRRWRVRGRPLIKVTRDTLPIGRPTGSLFVGDSRCNVRRVYVQRDLRELRWLERRINAVLSADR